MSLQIGREPTFTARAATELGALADGDHMVDRITLYLHRAATLSPVERSTTGFPLAVLWSGLRLPVPSIRLLMTEN